MIEYPELTQELQRDIRESTWTTLSGTVDRIRALAKIHRVKPEQVLRTAEEFANARTYSEAKPAPRIYLITGIAHIIVGLFYTSIACSYWYDDSGSFPWRDFWLKLLTSGIFLAFGVILLLGVKYYPDINKAFWLVAGYVVNTFIQDAWDLFVLSYNGDHSSPLAIRFTLGVLVIISLLGLWVVISDKGRAYKRHKEALEEAQRNKRLLTHAGIVIMQEPVSDSSAGSCFSASAASLNNKAVLATGLATVFALRVVDRFLRHD